VKGRGVRSGVGVDKEEEVKAEEAVPEQPEYQESVGRDGLQEWSDKPTYTDQYHKYPETCRKGPPMMAVFVITDAAGLKECNALLARSAPAQAPGIVVDDLTKEHHEGSWSVFMRYRKVSYKKLIKQR